MSQELAMVIYEPAYKDGYGGVKLLETNGDGEDRPGYLRQEIEGIGGVVKKKVKKRVKVGKTVKEHEDEKERREYLIREIKGECRSWCGWCNRVIPSVADRKV